MGAVLAAGKVAYDLIVQRRGTEPLGQSVARLPAERRPAPSARLMNVRVERDPWSGSLGLDLSECNELRRLLDGHPTAHLGGWREGDLVVGIDGVATGGRRVAELLAHKAQQQRFQFAVLRDEEAPLAALLELLVHAKMPRRKERDMKSVWSSEFM